MGSTPINNVPWRRQEVEGSKWQIFERELVAKLVVYAAAALVYELSQYRWWTVVIAVPGILIAVILQLHRPSAPLSIFGNRSKGSAES